MCVGALMHVCVCLYVLMHTCVCVCTVLGGQGHEQLVVVSGGLAQGDQPGALGAAHPPGEHRLHQLQQSGPTLLTELILTHTNYYIPSPVLL